jgi:hypothetical protein
VVVVNPGCIIAHYAVDTTFDGAISGSGTFWTAHIALDENDNFFADMLGGYDLIVQMCFKGGSVTISSSSFTDANYGLWVAPYNSAYSSSYVHNKLPMTNTRFGVLSNSNRTFTPVANNYVDANNFDAGIVSQFRFTKTGTKRTYKSADGNTISFANGIDVGLGSTSSLGTVTYSNLDIMFRLLLVS